MRAQAAAFLAASPLLLGLGCERVAPPAAPGPAAAGSASSLPAPIAGTVHLELTVPKEIGTRGTLLVVPLTEEELAQGRPGSATFFAELLQRVQIRRDVVTRDGIASVDLVVPPDRRTLLVSFDGAGLGLDALFGPRPGLASGSVTVAADAPQATVTLQGKAFKEPKEDCSGEREQALVIDAPETRREGDAGKRFVCVHLPVSYAASPQRRYPLVLVFPGYSGLATGGNVWQQRALFDRIGAEAGEAIFVGVATRVVEGTSYLQRTKRFGDWDHFITDHLLREIETRFRTTGRRGTIGHSTGGWMSIAVATRHPDLFAAAASSSPDALDFRTWLLDERGAVRTDWLAWLRTEAQMGGSGQFVSYAAAWSDVPGPGTSGRGFDWPVDLSSGKIVDEVFQRWIAASPAAELVADPTRTRKLSGKLLVTAGSGDEFGLFAPTERYVKLLNERGIEAKWIPTELGHFGKDDVRFAPLVRGLLERLR